MWKQQLCMSIMKHYGVPLQEQIHILADAGFDGIFSDWYDNDVFNTIARTAKDCGMIYQSVHAPYEGVDKVWKEGPEGERFIELLKNCLRDCERHDVNLMVLHAFIGFEEHNPTMFGVERFADLASYAQKLGVRIAFENTEGEEYLASVMSALRECSSVGFCWDTGHEMCYNHSQNMMALYGDRLLGTHLNDNLGIRDSRGKITWHDDLHLLPYDGIADWDEIAGRLSSFSGPLTFELNRCNKPNRLDNQRYIDMDFKEYIALAYARACKVAAACIRRRESGSEHLR